MIGENWSDETPTTDERLLAAGEIIARKDAEIQRLVDVLDDLLTTLANEGYAHSDACFCEECEVISRAKRVLKETPETKR